MKLIYVKTWSGNEVYLCEKNYEISILETLNGKWNLCIREIIKLVHAETTKKNISHNITRAYSKDDGGPYHLEHLDGFNPIQKNIYFFLLKLIRL